MLKLKLFAAVFVSLTIVGTIHADDQKMELQKYINEIVSEVKEAETPLEKREILNDLFNDLKKSFEAAKSSPFVPVGDHSGIDVLENKMIERQNELNGENGYEIVSDEKLDSFASFTLQDIEQADSTVTIGIGTLIIIILLAILVF